MAIGDLVVNLVARTERFTKGLNVARGAMSRFVGGVSAGIGAVAKFGAVAGAAMGAVSLKAVQLAAEAEQTGIAFEVLTGSVKLAEGLIADLRKMGAATPFEFRDLAQSTRTLLSFGRASDQVLDDLGMLSNVASGNAQTLSSLALVYGQVAANARLTGGDLLQFINTGFNPLQQIAERTGETMMELRDRMSRGAIGFEEVRQAFVDATSAGGRFFQMNEKQSKTLLGRWSTLQDELTEIMIGIGESLMKNLDLKEIIAGASSLAKVFADEMVPALLEMSKSLGQIVKDLKVFEGGVLGKEAGKNFERHLFLLKALSEGMTIEEAVDARRRIEQTEKDMPLNRQVDEMMSKFRTDAADLLQQTRERVQTDRAERLARQSMARDMDRGLSRFGAIQNLDDVFPVEKMPEFLREWFEEFQAQQFADLEKAMRTPDLTQKQINRSEQMLAGFIRQGLSALESGLMSLGPMRQPEPAFAGHRARTLEADSAEAFEVLRANVGKPGKQEIEKSQLQQLKQANKNLEKIAMKLTQKGQWVDLRGLD